MQTLIVKLPPPGRTLSPNGRVHWSKKSKATAKARLDAGLAATAAIREQGVTVPFAKATVQVRSWVTKKIFQDDDNLNASCKAYFDGLADAGIVANDRDFTRLPPVQLVQPIGKPYIELIITEVEP